MANKMLIRLLWIITAPIWIPIALLGFVLVVAPAHAIVYVMEKYEKQ